MAAIQNTLNIDEKLVLKRLNLTIGEAKHIGVDKCLTSLTPAQVAQLKTVFNLVLKLKFRKGDKRLYNHNIRKVMTSGTFPVFE